MLNELADRCLRIKHAKGFILPNSRDSISDLYMIAAQLMLISSEVAEALEVIRNKNNESRLEVELADVIIRTIELMRSMGFDIDACVNEKIAYNESREYQHGGKFF
jgi:NTP pyrophosphatase (non-canonical NTP hydrolase)